MVAKKSKEKFTSLKNGSFIDLFAGIGGFHLGMESVGMKCVFASEWDKHAAAVYENNFGLKPNGDITKINEKEIPDHDLLCGGFPCQAFSISGKRMGFEDTRGTLFFDVARIIAEKNPKVVFLENVRNFESHDNGKTLEIVLKTFKDLKYNVFHKVINAAELGFATARQRIYFVAFRSDLGISDFSFPEATGVYSTVASCVNPDLSAKELKRLRIPGRHNIDKKKDAEVVPGKAPVRIGVIGKGGQGNRIYSEKSVGITLSAYGGGRAAKTGAYYINGIVRKLHETECAKMMGFPETYKTAQSHSQAYKQFGNSVVVGVIKSIAAQIESRLNKG